MSVIDIRPRQLAQAIDSIAEVQVTATDRSILIRIRSFKGFAPDAFDGMPTRLLANRMDGETLIREQETPVLGHLRLLPSGDARGTWFTYHFVPDQTGEETPIVFRGTNQWSNVRETVFLTERGECPARNPFHMLNMPDVAAR